MQAPPQCAILCVLHHGQVARHAQREFPAWLAIRVGRLARRGHDIGRNADQVLFAGNEQRPGIGRVQHVLLEPRRQVRHLLVQRLEPRFGHIGQLRAAKLEIAQFVVDQPLLRGVEHGEGRSLAQRAIARIQPQVLRHVGVEIHELRLVGVVSTAQLRRIHHGVEVSDGSHARPRWSNAFP
jgi:hypothetical protein